MSDSEERFDPRRYLTKVSGQDYLEVKWRLYWLRTDWPNAVIETECLRADDKFALFKATVSLPASQFGDGRSASGHGSEVMGDFRDYIEKAETKAIGRALAALGFGTQFCNDFADAADGRIADSPINLQAHRPQSTQSAPQRSNDSSYQNAPNNAPRGESGTDPVATPRQLQFITSIARELGIDDERLTAESVSTFGVEVSALSRRDASVMIERLQARRMEQASMLPTDRASQSRQ